MKSHRSLCAVGKVIRTRVLFILNPKTVCTKNGERFFSTGNCNEDVIGIDLGSTSSRVAAMEWLLPTVIETLSGRATPSAVTMSSDRGILVGEVAKRYAFTHNVPLFCHTKTRIGRRHNEEQALKLKDVPFEIATGTDGCLKGSNTVFTPTVICGLIMKELKNTAETYLRRHVSKAVIAVPVNVSAAQQKEIEEACRFAGLEVLAIIKEPLAALLSSTRLSDGTFVVFDMGGGSCEVSVIDTCDGEFKVRAWRSDSFLNGEEFDLALRSYLLKKMKEEYGCEVGSDHITQKMVMDAAEKAKIDLSSFPNTQVRGVFVTNTGPISMSITISRSEYEGVAKELIEKAKVLCQSCLEEANISKKDIKGLVLIGGMSKAHGVQEAVSGVFGRSPTLMDVDREEAVVVGAAMHGKCIIEERKSFLPGLLPLSICIETCGKSYKKVIKRNSTLPAEGCQLFTTEFENQDKAWFRLFFGEARCDSTSYLFVKEFLVNGIEPAPQGIPRIKLSLKVDEEGALVVFPEVNGEEREPVRMNLPFSSVDEKLVRRLVKDEILRGAEIFKTKQLEDLRCKARVFLMEIEGILEKKKHLIEKEKWDSAFEASRDLKSCLDLDDPYLLWFKLNKAKQSGWKAVPLFDGYFLV